MSRMLINTRKSFAKLFIIFVMAFANPTITHAMPVYDVLGWITTGIGSIFSSFLGCDNISSVSSRYNIGNVAIDVSLGAGSQNDTWLFASRVTNGRMMKLQWNTNGIVTAPRKYIVFYRIDPRFARPVTYILEYNHVTSQYVSDFHTFSAGDLLNHQSATTAASSMYQDFDDYVNFRNGRSKIPVSDADVVNITLKDSNFIDTQLASQPHSNFRSVLDKNDITKMSRNTNLPDNRILYMNAARWCAFTSADSSGAFDDGRDLCKNNLIGGVYDAASGSVYTNNLFGKVNSATGLSSLSSCATSVTGGNHPPCVYDKGRGMQINIGSNIIKPTFEEFYRASGTAASGNEVFVLYHKSRGSGELDFGTTIPMSGQYSNHTQHMKDWSGARYNSDTNMRNYLRSAAGQSDTLMNFIHAGSYIMFVQVGNSEGPAGYHQHDNLRLSYIVSSTTPAASVQGTAITSQTFMENAPRDGNLYVKVNNSNPEVSGTIRVSYAVYGGHAGGVFLSEVLYDTIAGPVMSITRDTARLVFGGLANNPSWQLVVRAVMTLYIIIFGLSFLIGKVQITSMELVKRLAKLAVIFAVFQPGSWSFFHDNVFRMFLDGMSYLTYSVTGVTSRVGNIFGFVDVIFDKYFDWKIWRALLVNLLQIHNGMIIIAILMIDAIIWYLMAVIDVVISYILAFMTMCVLISLAPIVVLCMLFERTKGIFDNWTSMFLNYMVQPTILLIFFLILDQLMTVQFNHVNMEVCWDWLIQFTIDIPIGDLFRVRFAIPFFPGIPFYVPYIEDQITCPFTNDPGELGNVLAAALMFKVYAQIGQGLVQYVTNVVARITNVMPARLRGQQGKATTPATAVSSHLGAPRRYVRDAMSKGIKGAYAGAKEGWENPSKDGAGKGKRSGGAGDKGSGRGKGPDGGKGSGDDGGSTPKMG